MGDPRRAGDQRPARRRGAPVRRQAPRGLPCPLRGRGRVRRQREGGGRRRLSHRARPPEGGAVNRAERVLARLPESEVDAVLIAAPANIRYLTGFGGSNALAIVGPDLRRFITDFRYVERAAGEVAGFEVQRGERELSATLARGWPDGPLRLGFEDDHVSVRQHAKLRDALPERIELVPAGGIVESVRAVKDVDEVAAIRAAAELTDAAYRGLAE